MERRGCDRATEFDFLCKWVSILAIASGATTINVPDLRSVIPIRTNMGAVPAALIENGRKLRQGDLVGHCHNDLGLSQVPANSSRPSPIWRPTDRMAPSTDSCERAGNARWKRVVMAMKVPRGHAALSRPGPIRLPVTRLGPCVQPHHGFPVQLQQGHRPARTLFRACEKTQSTRGRHAKNAETYEIHEAEDVAFAKTSLGNAEAFGAPHAFRDRSWRALGYLLEGECAE